MGTAAELLFRISGDSSEGEAALAGFRASLAETTEASRTASAKILYDWAGNPIKTLGPEFAAMGTAAEAAGGRAVGSSRGAREAIRGLGEEMGVHMPRFVGSWLASLGPVAGIMSAAFAPIAAIGLIEVISKLPGAIHSGILALEGFGAAAQKAFQEATRAAIQNETDQLEYNERLRDLDAIGLEGAKMRAAQLDINHQKAQAALKDQRDLLDQLDKAKAIGGPKRAYSVEELSKMSIEQQRAILYPEEHSAADVAKAKTQIPELEKRIQELTKHLTDLDVEAQRLAREGAAAAAKEGEEAVKAAAKRAEQREKKEIEVNDRILRAAREYADKRQKIEDDLAKRWIEVDEQGAALSREVGERTAEDTARNAEKAFARLDEAEDRAHEEAIRKQEQFDGEMARLAEDRARIMRKDETPGEQIRNQYAADVEKFRAAEEKETAEFSTDLTKRAALETQYAAIRAALYSKEQTDLQLLHNSTGWQGVFGSEFAQMIRGDAALMQQWASSTNQSHMMVRASLEGLKETGEKTFESLAAGMGANIASAIVHSKSVKEAMRAAAESTLESLAAQALTWAIYATGMGFWDLAIGDESGAAQAFAAAAIWGSVGAAAAVAGRAMAGGAQGGAGAAAGGGTADRSRASEGGSAAPYGTAAGQGLSHVTLNVYGHVIGPDGAATLVGMLNDAVLGGGHTLTATNTTTGIQVTR